MPAIRTGYSQAELVNLHQVNLFNLERLHKQKPFYSRSLLLQITEQQAIICREACLEDANRTVQDLTWQAPDGQVTKVWKKDPKQKEKNWIGRCNVRVNWMPRVAFDQDFQRKWGHRIGATSWLRKYNDSDDAEQVHLNAPYALSIVKNYEENEHLHAPLMRRTRAAIAQSWTFLESSETYKTFTKTIERIAATSPPIHKIVCFGLGNMTMLGDLQFGTLFQVMSVFSIAKTLHKCYKEVGKEPEKIQIFLQDPDYDQIDWTLMGELHQAMKCDASSGIRFVDDPDGLLAIDGNTMVVAPMLILQLPWMQIIADLFASGSGPAVIIGDHLPARREKKMYTLFDRDSPAVAKFLSERYVIFQKPTVGPEEAFCRTNPTRAELLEYWEKEKRKLGLPAEMAECSREHLEWLSGMYIYVRKGEDA